MIQIQSPYVDEWGREHRDLEKRYSDRNKQLLQVDTGRKLADGIAIDVIPCRYTYQETDEDVPTFENEEEII